MKLVVSGRLASKLFIRAFQSLLVRGWVFLCAVVGQLLFERGLTMGISRILCMKFALLKMAVA